MLGLGSASSCCLVVLWLGLGDFRCHHCRVVVSFPSRIHLNGLLAFWAWVLRFELCFVFSLVASAPRLVSMQSTQVATVGGLVGLVCVRSVCMWSVGEYAGADLVRSGYVVSLVPIYPLFAAV